MQKNSISGGVVFFITFAALSCISLWRFNIAQVFYYDFGIFARPLWEIAHGLTPLIIHKSLGEIHFLGDHFTPSIYLLSPLFLFSHSLELLLIEQVGAVCLSGVLLFLIARQNKLSYGIASLVVGVYLMFAGTVNPLVTDWHTESTAAVFLLLFILLFFYKKQYGWGIGAAVLFLGWKESNALTLCFSLIPFFFSQKKLRFPIAAICISAVFWFMCTTRIIIPNLSGHPYYYSPTLPHFPLEWIQTYFNSSEKIKLLFQSFISFGFLPLLSGVYLLPIIAELGIRFLPLDSHFQSFSFGMHYNVFLGVFLTLATIDTLSHFKNKNTKLILTVILVVLTVFSAKKITKSPLLLLTNHTFWAEWNVPSPLITELSCVPLHGSIMSQNNILPHLIKRKEKIFLLTQNYQQIKPETIVFDMTPEQNMNNYYSGEIHSVKQVKTLILAIQKDSNYYQDTSRCTFLLLFRRKNRWTTP